MLNDLAALTPPFLVCVAFLFAVAAFVRHEMRRAKNPDEADGVENSAQAPANMRGENLADTRANTGSPSSDGADESHQARADDTRREPSA